MELLISLAILLLSAGTALLCIGRLGMMEEATKKREAILAQRRVEDQRRLADARARYVIAVHELELDSYALKMACMEMSQIKDEDDHPLWGDGWEDIRENLYLMAKSFDAAMGDKALEMKIRGAC